MSNSKTLLVTTHPENQAINELIPVMYDKWKQPLFNTPLPIHIFDTGSDGNSVFLKNERTLIDLGLSMKRYTTYDPNFFLQVNYIIITHHHQDHLNPSTLHYILENYPHIKVIMHDFTYEYITSNYFKPKYKKLLDQNGKTQYEISRRTGMPDKTKPLYHIDMHTHEKIIESLPWQEKFKKHKHRIIHAGPMNLTTFDQHTFYLEPLTVKHGDILNIAIQIYHAKFELRLLYASDLDNLGGQNAFVDHKGNMQHVTGLSQTNKYNVILQEANYDEAIVEEYLNQLNADDPDYYQKKARVSGNLRHISEQETFHYIKTALDDNGVFIPLHASRTFGTLFQS